MSSKKNYLYIFIFTFLFNSSIAFLLSFLLKGDFWIYLIISQSIGLSIMIGNFLIPYSQYTTSFIKIIIYSVVGLLIGVFIGINAAQIIFDKVVTPPIFSALFFGSIAIAFVWLMLKKNETKEALSLIKNKLNKNSKEQSKYLNWIKSADAKGTVYLINIKDVLYFQAQQKYTTVATQNQDYIINMTVKDLLKQLNPDAFWQIHRGTVVNLNFIEKISKNEEEKLTAFLTNATQLNISRSFVHLFKRM